MVAGDPGACSDDMSAYPHRCSPATQSTIGLRHNNPMRASASREGIAEIPSRAIQLFEPPEDAIYTIDATAHLVGVPRRTILVYCKHQLLSPVISRTNGGGYCFDRDGVHALRRIEALRAVCGDDLSGIKIILDLTKEVERLRSVVRFAKQMATPNGAQWKISNTAAGEKIETPPREEVITGSNR
jgi:DNA-binding transcriptional MerR regulator